VILEPIYLYCGRTGSGLWEEPLSLVASFAFVAVAVQVWRSAGELRLLRVMAGLIFLLWPAGLWLHFLPSPLAVGADIGPILLLVLTCFYGVNRDMVGLSRSMAAVCTLLILPFAAVSLPLIALLHGAAGSAAYVPLPVLLLGYAAVLRPERPDTARGLLQAALIMVVAIVARAVDLPLCGVWPLGTHFLWILGTAVLLWYLARVYRRHMLAGLAGGG
jgi:hypothetical protein